MSQFFTVGGTLPLDAVYVVRPVDEQLYRVTLAGEYCNVLTPRQMGKSSLMVRTARRLQREGVCTATIDLTDIGTELGADEWYLGLITRLREQLDLAVDERAWWDAHAQQGPVQRFSDFLRDIVLQQTAGPVVVFVDEIDSTLKLPFTDDFFAVIRAAYNARASDPAYKRLTFVLLGVVRPADLIKNRFRTPYNIGRSIDLQDFTLQEANALLPGLEAASLEQAEAILERVLYWTGGHPYLTQKVCAGIVAGDDGPWSDERIDRLVRRLFLSDEARKESNLQYVRDRIYESHDREKLLRVYRQVLAEKSVANEERDPIKNQLKLVGLLNTTSDDTLVVRNRIYATVFDAQWIKKAMPRITSTRITVVSIVVALIALALVAFLLYADEIHARRYEDGFHSAEDAAEQVRNLAGLFRLGSDKFTTRARDLFFDLDAEKQLRTFTDLAAPEQAGDDLQIVIRGLYTHLENGAQPDKLLQAMRDDVRAIKTAFPDSSILCGELDAWLQGRNQHSAGDYEGAITAYNRAIQYIGQNPAIYLDRALAHAHLDQHVEALTDLTHVIEQHPNRRAKVISVVQSHPALRDYLTTHAQAFATLAELVE
jgi:tetratricopeptide (TPR) repeat protein